MAARKYHIANLDRHVPAPPPTHMIADPTAHEPVDSPALQLQHALRDAGFESIEARHWRRLGRTALALSLICVYVIAVMMIIGQIRA